MCENELGWTKKYKGIIELWKIIILACDAFNKRV